MTKIRQIDEIVVISMSRRRLVPLPDPAPLPDPPPEEVDLPAEFLLTDQTESAGVLTEVAGLSVSLPAGITTWLTYELAYRTSITTCGIGLSLDIPTGATGFFEREVGFDRTATVAGWSRLTQDAGAAVQDTGSISAANAPLRARVTALITTTAPVQIRLMFRREAAATAQSATLYRGCYVTRRDVP